ncbi:ImmA/IrrE family metallo-endopeptidase [Schaalia sp. 19OD2882]|uniref:helix-turn-helix domain-containing protein n=1 Tax=Schaalia sp. 19OD2882 TaxID=2794089 RepID=UPI001C1F0462|nr:XRE family transcriptional regulator [Schaalia sp. 19OD2882]QWW19793.1 ImmA/IrrE family metallo-endopeptidase [Schaalia sp. 19OD2882]
MLPTRIRLFRTGRGLDQRVLARQCGLERTALTRVESGERKVSAIELLRIASALDTTLLDLLSQPEPTVMAAGESIVEEATASERAKFRAEVEIDRAWRDLQQLHECDLIEAVKFPFDARGLSSRDDARKLAKNVRRFLGVGDRPLGSMSNVAADLGLWCRTTEADIDGLSFTPEAGLGVALIGEHLDPGRRRATVAHEIGHHVSGDTCERSSHYLRNPDAEALVDAFAAELLLPSAVVRKNRSPSRNDMVKLAVDYRVSWSLVIASAQEADVDLSKVDPIAIPVDNDFYGAVGHKPEEDVTPPGLASKWVMACVTAVEKCLITTGRRASEMTLGVYEVRGE